MSKLYSIPGSESNPLVSFDFMNDHYEPSVKKRLEKKADKVEGKELSDNNFDNAYKAKLDQLETTLSTLEQKITKAYQAAIEQAKSEVQIKASDSQPEAAEENTVWIDKTNKLIKVKIGGDWVPMGAVYQ